MKIFTKSSLFLAVLFMLLVSSAFGQKFTNKGYEIISSRIDSVLNAYAKYSTFTENFNELSSDYISEFKGLFTGNRAKLFNDLKINKSNQSDLNSTPISPAQYVKLVEGRFKHGLGIKILNVTKDYSSIPKKKNKSGKHLINISFDKKIFGFSSNNQKLDATYHLIMTIEFSSPSSKDYKIVSILSKPQLKKELSAQNYNNKYEVGLTFLPVYSSMSKPNNLPVIDGKDIPYKSKTGHYTFNFNLFVAYYPWHNSKNYQGVSLGLGRSILRITYKYEYNGTMKDDVTISTHDVTILYRYRSHNFLQKSKSKFLKWLEYYGNAGLNFSVVYGDQSVVSIPGHADIHQAGGIYSVNMNLGTSFVFEGGFYGNIGKHFLVSSGLYINYFISSITNIEGNKDKEFLIKNKTATPYFTSYFGKVKPWLMGASISFAYRF